MSRLFFALVLAAVLLLPRAGDAGLFGPSNYDECITDSMKGVSSDVAARAIIEACRNQFPDKNRPAPQQQPAPPPAAAGAQANPAPQAAPAPRAAPQAAAVPTGTVRDLTDAELARLGSVAKMFGSSYRIKFHNGNEHVTVTEVTIAVWDESDAGASRREYPAAVTIAPQDSGEAKYTVHYRGDPTAWTWAVVSAKGVE